MYIPPPANRFAVIDLAPVINTTWNLTTLEGTGGGCVTTGPFAGWTVPFGPVGPNITDSMRDNLINLIKYRPHCLSRSFRPKTAAYSFNQVSLDAILQSPNITEFNQRLTFIINPTVPTILNLHGKGHQGMSSAIYIKSSNHPICCKRKKPKFVLTPQQFLVARWGTSTAARGTPYSIYITPRSIAYGLSGKPKTHLRANTQSVVPETSFLPRPVPSFSSRIPSIWRNCRHTDRDRFEISSTQREALFVMNMCSFDLLYCGQIIIYMFFLF